jgi:hypothetical protein
LDPADEFVDADGPFACAKADADENVARRGQPLPYEAPPPGLVADLRRARAREIRRCSIYGAIMDAGVIVTVPLLIAVLLFQRCIVVGLTTGGVK